MSTLRVALDVTALIGPPTGVHQVTRGLLDALAERDDIEVHGWMLTARGARPMLDISVRRSRIPAALATRGWSRSRLPPGRLITGRADVVHGTNFLAPPNPRSIITLQDLTPFTHPEWCEPAVATKAAPLRNAVRRGATIHVSSALVAEEAIDVLGIDRERVRLVHHGLRPIAGGDAATGRSVAGAERYVLVLGTVEVRKNVTAAVAALTGLPDDVTIVIAGPRGNGEDDLAAITKKVAPHRVVRLPAVDEITRNSLLRGAVVLAFPSRYEGFAMPPLEALSVGTPVVTTAVGALPELIGDMIPLVAAGDDNAFAEALRAAVDAPPDVTSEVCERVLDLTWTRAAEAMVDVYRDVAGR